MFKPDYDVVQTFLHQIHISPNYRELHDFTWPQKYLSIFADYFEQDEWEDARVAVLGPGHFWFAALVSQLGCHAVNVEIDHASAALGRYLGFEVVERDFYTLSPETFEPVDGVFSKFSLWLSRLQTAEATETFYRQLDSLLKPCGWGFLAPWNGDTTASTEDSLEQLAAAQVDTLRALGWEYREMTEDEANGYGAPGSTVYNRPLFTKNREWRPNRTWVSVFDMHDPRLLHQDAGRASKTSSVSGLMQLSSLLGDKLHGAKLLCLGSNVRGLVASLEKAGATVDVLEKTALGTPEAPFDVDGIVALGFPNAFENGRWRRPSVLARYLDELVTDRGWGLLMGANARTSVYPNFLSEQLEAFRVLGWDVLHIAQETAIELGLPGDAVSYPVFSRGLDPQALRAALLRMNLTYSVVANSPEWEWIRERLGAVGYRVARSFNAEFDEHLPTRKREGVVVTRMADNVSLPERYHSEYLPFANAEITEAMQCRDHGVLHGQTRNGRPGIVIFAHDRDGLKAAVSML